MADEVEGTGAGPLSEETPIEAPVSVEPVAKRKPKSEEPPTWAKDLLARLETSVEVGKTAQGQARRAEKRVEDLSMQLMNALAARQSQPQQADPYADLDMTDPTTRILASRIRILEAQIQQQGQQVQTQAMSAAEQTFRQNTIAELQEKAEDADVEWATVNRLVEGLPSQELWLEGKRILREAKQKRPKGGELDIEALRKEERQKLVDAFVAQGLFTEETLGILTQPQDLDAVARNNELFNRGEMSPEEFKRQNEALTKRGT